MTLPARLHLKRITRISVDQMSVIFELMGRGLTIAKIAPVYQVRENYLRIAIALAKEEGFEAVFTAKTATLLADSEGQKPA